MAPKQVPVVQWAQDMLKLFLKLEIKTTANVGRAEVKDLRVTIEPTTLRISYAVDEIHYELDERLLREVDPDLSKYALTGRTLNVELHKARPSGWKRPFSSVKGRPKWLKTDFDRWNEDVVLSDGSDDEGGDDKKKAPAGDLRSALREVEQKEKAEREARQRELEESIKRGKSRGRAKKLPTTWTWTASIDGGPDPKMKKRVFIESRGACASAPPRGGRA